METYNDAIFITMDSVDKISVINGYNKFYIICDKKRLNKNLYKIYIRQNVKDDFYKYLGTTKLKELISNTTEITRYYVEVCYKIKNRNKKYYLKTKQDNNICQNILLIYVIIAIFSLYAIYIAFVKLLENIQFVRIIEKDPISEYISFLAILGICICVAILSYKHFTNKNVKVKETISDEVVHDELLKELDRKYEAIIKEARSNKKSDETKPDETTQNETNQNETNQNETTNESEEDQEEDDEESKIDKMYRDGVDIFEILKYREDNYDKIKEEAKSKYGVILNKEHNE